MDELRAKIAALEAELARPVEILADGHPAVPTKTWQEWVRMILEILKMILDQIAPPPVPPVPNP